MGEVTEGTCMYTHHLSIYLYVSLSLCLFVSLSLSLPNSLSVYLIKYQQIVEKLVGIEFCKRSQKSLRHQVTNKSPRAVAHRARLPSKQTATGTHKSKRLRTCQSSHFGTGSPDGDEH